MLVEELQLSKGSHIQDIVFQKLSAIILLTKSKRNNLGVDKNEY